MKYVVIVETCNCFKGSHTEYEKFDSLMEAWSFYKNFPAYYYAGNDYYLVKKPYLSEYDNNERGYNNHHFYTNEWCRITKEHNLKNGYVYSKEFGCWIKANENEIETDTNGYDLFPSLFEDLPF